jgi:hypothetical protein
VPTSRAPPHYLPKTAGTCKAYRGPTKEANGRPDLSSFRVWGFYWAWTCYLRVVGFWYPSLQVARPRYVMATPSRGQMAAGDGFRFPGRRRDLSCKPAVVASGRDGYEFWNAPIAPSRLQTSGVLVYAFTYHCSRRPKTARCRALPTYISPRSTVVNKDPRQDLNHQACRVDRPRAATAAQSRLRKISTQRCPLAECTAVRHSSHRPRT